MHIVTYYNHLALCTQFRIPQFHQSKSCCVPEWNNKKISEQHNSFKCIAKGDKEVLQAPEWWLQFAILLLLDPLSHCTNGLQNTAPVIHSNVKRPPQHVQFLWTIFLPLGTSIRMRFELLTRGMNVFVPHLRAKTHHSPGKNSPIQTRSLP